MSRPYDYLIIGAGILGTSLGLRLREAGKTVLILDMMGVAAGASGGNLGQISLMDRFEAWHMGFALESLEQYRFLEKSESIGFRQHGGAILLMNETQLQRARNVRKLQSKRGISMEILSPLEAKKSEPGLRKQGLKALAYCREEGSLDPLLLTYRMADAAAQAGVEIREKEAVLELVTSSHAIERVVTNQDVYRASVVINCAGAWAGRVAGLGHDTLPLQSHKGMAMVTQPLPPFLRSTLVGGGFLMEETGDAKQQPRIGTAITQQPGGSIIIGQATEDADADLREVGYDGLIGTAANLLGYFPGLRDAQIIRAWAVATPYAIDGRPVLGYSQRLDNFFTVAGFKGAFTTAPAIAAKAAKMLMRGERFIRELEPGRERRDAQCG